MGQILVRYQRGEGGFRTDLHSKKKKNNKRKGQSEEEKI